MYTVPFCLAKNIRCPCVPLLSSVDHYGSRSLNNPHLANCSRQIGKNRVSETITKTSLFPKRLQRPATSVQGTLLTKRRHNSTNRAATSYTCSDRRLALRSTNHPRTLCAVTAQRSIVIESYE